MLLLLYQLCFPLLGLALAVRFLLAGRSSTLAEGRRELRQRLGRLGEEELSTLRGGPVLWVHAASLGEAAAAAPLLKALPEGGPRVLLTASTVAGRGSAARLKGVDSAALAPADLAPAVSAFLDRVKPYALILIETELWPVTLRLAARRGVRIGIANGRLSAKAFSRYRWIRGTMASVLGAVAKAAVQTEEDAARFIALGVPEKAVLVTGNLKHDIPPPQAAAAQAARSLLAGLGWGRDPVWVAGSTRPGAEEEGIIAAFLEARKAHPRLRLVLAPRHVERAQEAAQLLRKRGIRFERFSEAERGAANHQADCLLVDVTGRLSALYAAGHVAFVGGTLAPIGGHNLLEPAISGKPVFFGPHTETVAGPAKALDASGGGFRAPTASALGKALSRLLGDPANLAESGRRARETAERLTGATRRTLEHLESLLRP